MEFLSDDSVIRKLYLPMQWMIMPLFYLHVHELIFGKKTSLLNQFYLLAPVACVFVLHLLHFFYSYNNIPISAMPDYYAPGLLLYTNFASFLFNGIILYLIYKMLRNSIEITKKVARRKYMEQRWYMTIVVLFIVIITVGLSTTISLIQFKIDHTWLVYTIFLLVSFVGYYMGYVGVYRSTLRGEYKTPINSVSRNGANTYQKIHSYIIAERRYLDIDLNLSEIAEKFNISSGYLSQLINTNSDQNFNDYINALRIDASKKMLLQNQFENYTIESIGLECGFKSKSNFYNAFKKFTRQTPTAYVKSQEIRPES